MMRISRQLMVPESYSEDEMLYFLKQVEDLVDIVNVSAGMDCYGGTVERYEANVHTHTTVFEPQYYNAAFARRVKQECRVKVALVGGITDPVVCEQLIAEGARIWSCLDGSWWRIPTGRKKPARAGLRISFPVCGA